MEKIEKHFIKKLRNTIFILPLVIFSVIAILLIVSASLQRFRNEISSAEASFVSDLKKNSDLVHDICLNIVKQSENIKNNYSVNPIDPISFENLSRKAVSENAHLKTIRYKDFNSNQTLAYPRQNDPNTMAPEYRGDSDYLGLKKINANPTELIFQTNMDTNVILELTWNSSVFFQDTLFSEPDNFDALMLVDAGNQIPFTLSIIESPEINDLPRDALQNGINTSRSSQSRPLATISGKDNTEHYLGYLRIKNLPLGISGLRKKSMVLADVPRHTLQYLLTLVLIAIAGFLLTATFLRLAKNKIKDILFQMNTDVMDAQHKLNQSLSYREFLLEHLDDCITHHTKSGSLLYASPAARRDFDFGKPPLQENAFLNLVHPDDRNDIDDFWHHLSSNPDLDSIQYRMIKKNGDIIWVETKFKPIQNNEIIGDYICLTHDITQYVLSENALCESEYKYRSLLDFAPMGIFQLSSKGNLTFANPAMANMFKFDSQQDLLAETEKFSFKNIFFNDPAQFDKTLKIVSENSGQWQGFDLDFKRQDNSEFTARMYIISQQGIQPDTFDYSGFIEDNSLQAHVESALELSENRFRRLFSQSPVAMMLLDSSLQLQDYNDSLKIMMGLTDQSELEKDIIFSDKNFSLLKDTIRSTKDSANINFQFDFKSANQKPLKAGKIDLEITIIRLTPESKENHDEGYAIFFQDITDKKQIQNQLMHVQKMEAVGRLAGGVAHDFNNLLQVVIGYGEIIMQDLEEETESKENLGWMMEASQRGMTLVRQLLAFSRREDLQLQPVDISDLLTNLMKMLRRIIGEHIQLKLKRCDELPLTYTDPGQIEQVVMNLCVNAKDAMTEGGTITIRSYFVEPHENWNDIHTAIPENSYVVIEVKDDGPGIPEEIQYRVFEPFFTTKSADSGTGLGLATVYNIVKRHKGYLRLESEKDQGSVFSVYLPLMEDREKELDSDTVIPEGDALTTSGTILLAEDEERVRELLRNMLEHEGYTVITANNGMEAVTQFQLNSHRIDLLMLDVIMPGMNGKDVYDFVALTYPNIPVLFSSGYSHDLLQNDYMLKIPGKLIQKPYQRQELLRSVHELISTSKLKKDS